MRAGHQVLCGLRDLGLGRVATLLPEVREGMVPRQLTRCPRRAARAAGSSCYAVLREVASCPGWVDPGLRSGLAARVDGGDRVERFGGDESG